MAARIEVYDTHLRLYTPYSAGFVQELKARVYDVRVWHPDKKYWEVLPAWQAEMEGLIKKWFTTCQIIDNRTATISQTQQATSLAVYQDMPADLAEAYQALHLLPDAPLEAAEAVYKVYVKFTHPDIGGDAQAFQRHADAIAIIRGYLT